MEHDQPGKCLNCGASMTAEAKYCGHCGQKQIDKHDFSFSHLITHAVVDYFHMDSSFFNSIWPLTFKPGSLTNEYLAGKRVKYIHPFKLLLSISIVYFLVIPLAIKINSNEDKPKPGVSISANDTVQRDTTDLSLTFPGVKKMDIDSVKFLLKGRTVETYVDSVYPNSNWLTRHAVVNFIKLANEGADVFIERMIHKASKVIFILIPLFALILKLLYIRRKKLFYNHLIFSIHFHSFLFLILLIYAIFSFLPIDLPFYPFLICIFLYLLLSLRKVYLQGYLKTSLKFLFLSLSYLLIAVPIFGIFLIVFSAIF